ncbi:MAG: sodium-dependent transporter, partial [Burkholderiaceae bacterium]|nr:sodium-dependent transporter [Burkholderiaceae bacterium]
MQATNERSTWGSRLGFILASAGSAVGLGAIWKFPYMAGSNGGSAFILPYIVLTVLIGFVLLLIEMSIGREARAGAGQAFGRLVNKRWNAVGLLSVLTGFLILAFYQVIGGWCLNYLVDACMGNGLITDTSKLGDYFGQFVSNGTLSITMQLSFLALTAGVLIF